jgi:hypothetical protein
LRSAGSASSATAAGVTVVVGSSCVEPGGQQTVTVASRPGLQVSVNPRYSDGHMGNVYGGLAVAQTIGPDGTYREAWTLAVNTPLGAVTVYAGVASQSGPRVTGTGTSTFTIAAHC